MQDYGHQAAKSCAAHEDDKSRRTEEYYKDVEAQIGIERLCIATEPDKWVSNWVADPAAELAAIYKQAALFYDDEAMIGCLVRAIFANKIREISEYIVEE